MADEPESAEQALERRLRELVESQAAADDQRFERTLEELREVEQRLPDPGSTVTEPDETMSKRADEIADRARQLRADQEARAKGASRGMSNDPANARSLGLGLSIAYTFIGMPLLGVLVGWLLDRSLGTTTWKGVGMLVGAAVGFVMIFVLQRRSSQSSR